MSYENNIKNLVEETVKQNGFCKFNFTGTKQIEELRNLYSECFGDNEIAGRITLQRSGQVKNLRVNQRVKEILEKDISFNFPDYDFYIAHYIANQGGHKNSFELHQDWNIVDETKYSSCQIWIPMQFSYPENSGMFFIPRSHLYNQSVRSGSFDIPRIPISPLMYPYLSYARLLPGQAVAFQNRTLHGSFSNATPEHRIALLIALTQKGAPTIYYHLNKPTGKTEIYSVTANELLENLPVLEKGENTFTSSPIKVIDLPNQNNSSESPDNVLEWIKNDRLKISVPDDYEFKQLHIISNPEIEKEINNKGYTIINFLTDKELSQLQEGIRKPIGNDTEMATKFVAMHNEVQSIIKHRLDYFLTNYQCPISMYHKGRMDGAKHIDWHTTSSSQLNQHLECFYELWCPLENVGDSKSMIHVVPGSHRLINSLIHTYKPWPLQPYTELFNQYGIDIKLKAGQAILFDSRIVHAVAPVTEKGVECIVMRLAHIESDYFSIKQTDNNKAIVFEETNNVFFDSMLQKNNGSLPDSTGHTYYLFNEEISEEQVNTRLQKIDRISN